jgi:heme-degrading monooxygenase HmoA
VIVKIRTSSVDEVFASAFAERLAAWERLASGMRGNREEFLAVLDKETDAQPAPEDRI